VTFDQLQQVGDVQQEEGRSQYRSLRNSMHHRRSGRRGGRCSHVLDTSTEVRNKPLNHDTDAKDDTALSCMAVPMKSASDLSGFSFMYHTLTSVVQAARMDRPAVVLSTRIARWS